MLFRGKRLAQAVAAFALVASSLVLTMSASAQVVSDEPPCPAGTPLAVRIEPPKDGFIYGRETEIQVRGTDGYEDGGWGLVGLSVGEARLTATAADPSNPISHPFTKTVNPHLYGYDEESFAEHAEMLLERGDGPVALTATWEQYSVDDRTKPNCTGTTSVVVSGTDKGKAPTANAEWDLETSRDKRRSPRYFTYWQESINFNVFAARPEGEAAAGPVSVEVSGRGQSRSVTLDDQLDSRWHPSGGPAKGWSLTRRGEFIPSASFKGRGKFKYEIRFAGKVLDRGDFTLEHNNASSNKIFEGQRDAFFNTCIDSKRKLFSQGGRLYCWEYRYPALTSIKGVRR